MNYSSLRRRMAFCLVLVTLAVAGRAQTDFDSPFAVDSVAADSLPDDTILTDDLMRIGLTDSTVVAGKESSAKQRAKRDWSEWRPDPKRALWLALVIPGGGQFYNRKYWKLPLVYGGFMGCIYAMSWNNTMYKDYAQAYIDLTDKDPETRSYESFVNLNRRIDDSNKERYVNLFKKRKDRYRRWRDLSFFVMVGVYALSVIDAYVDAELSVFDISKDLSLKVEPGVIGTGLSRNPLQASAVGVNCSLNF